MLTSIGKFSKSFFIKLFVGIIILPFVFWGMGDVFRGGNQNVIASIDSERISTQEFVEYLRRLNLNEDQYVTAFQSRLTKKWLTPFTDEVIENYAKNNVKNILVIAPAFTTDNLETLIEIGDEYVELFNENGGDKLDFVSSLNDSDKWVDAIIAIMEK